MELDKYTLTVRFMIDINHVTLIFITLKLLLNISKIYAK